MAYVSGVNLGRTWGELGGTDLLLEVIRLLDLVVEGKQGGLGDVADKQGSFGDEAVGELVEEGVGPKLDIFSIMYLWHNLL